MGAKSLDELLNIDDLSEFGQKSEGLVKLYRIIQNTSLINFEGARIPVSIPDFFCVAGSELSCADVKHKYAHLARSKKPMINMARRSDPNEMPGEFVSHPSLYDPNDFDGSFQKWINAANKVKDSGSSAVVGQALASGLYNYRSKWDELDGFHMFGFDNVAFYAKSNSKLRGDSPSAALCHGLGSKIARGDQDIGILTSNNNRIEIFGLNHNYHMQSIVQFSQDIIDVIMLEQPDRFSSIRYPINKHTNLYIDYDMGSIPFVTDICSGNYYFELSPDDFLLFISELKNKLGQHFELEGCMNENGIYLVQIDEISKYRKVDLSVVDQNRILYKTNIETAIGEHIFTGNMYLSDKPVHMNTNDILYLTYIPSRLDLDSLKECANILFAFPDISGINEFSHRFGYATQLLLKLDKQRIPAIAIGENPTELRNALESAPAHRKHQIGNVMKITDVTVECDGTNAQIYLN